MLVLKDIRSRNIKSRKLCINQEFEREIYINYILYGGDMNCVNQIRMKCYVKLVVNNQYQYIYKSRNLQLRFCQVSLFLQCEILPSGISIYLSSDMLFK